MKLTIPTRMQPLDTGIFTELALRKQAAKEQGKSIIDLSIGSPDLPPPDVVIRTLTEAIQDVTRYGYTIQGLPSFHEAVAEFYEARYGVTLSASNEILQLMGSQDGLSHLALSLIDRGDTVLVPDPGYPIYHASVQLAEGNLYPMPLLADNGFLPDFDAIPRAVLDAAKLMILSYPGNPVTALCDRGFFEQVVRIAKRHNIIVAHDFAYSELVFDGARPVSFLSVPGAKDVGIEFNSFSKTFSMAGCRIGYVVGNRDVLRAIGLLKSHIDFGVFYPIQKAAEAALRADFTGLEVLADTYQARRDVFTNALHEVGWPIEKSPATMFAWATIPPGWRSREFAFGLLDEAGVAVTPGDAFGKEGEGYVRIAFVQSEQVLRDAAHRIGDFLRAHPTAPLIESPRG